MTGPPEQKEAPKGVDAHRGGKADGRNTVNAAESTAPVKCDSEGVRAARSAAAPLPCLNRNNSNEPPLTAEEKEKLNGLSTAHRKTAFALARNVAQLCAKYGVERIGFLTLTFKDHVTCAKEAGRRFNSLRTGVLAVRYVKSIAVLERMKSGRIHFHLLVVLAEDVRTGFNFDQAAAGVYTSANLKLRAEWAFWRATAPNYRFGRTELMPVKSNEEGLSKYVGKYIAKHIGSRETRDKGVRLVRYSGGANPCGTKFMFHSQRSRLWRWQVGEFARLNGCADLEALSATFGKRWAYFHRHRIIQLEPPETVVGVYCVPGQSFSEPITLRDVWHADRVVTSYAVATAIGCTQGEAYAGLFQRTMKPNLEYTVPAFSGQNLRKLRKEEEWDRTIVWADGRVERL